MSVPTVPTVPAALTVPAVPAAPTTLPTSALVDLVARKVAPIVHLYSKEQFYPASVSWYLSRVKLYRDSTLVEPAGAVTPAMLGAHSKPENPEGWNLVVDDSKNNSVGVHNLTQDVLDIYAGEPLVNGACNAEAYYHFHEVGGTIYLSFYFFYPVNGGMGPTAAWTVKPGHMGSEWGYYGHEGDWETVTFAFRRGSDDAHISVLWVAREAHGDDTWEWRNAADAAISDLQPIQVYSAWHSHASWAAAGEYHRPAPNPGIDYCDNGVLWDTSKRLVNFDAAPVSGSVSYSGLWGTARVIDFVPGLGPPLIDSGPHGPSTNPNWEGRPDGVKGIVFSPPMQIPNQHTSVPALAVGPFGDSLYMAYRGATNAEIWTTRTRDGLHWTDMRQIGQQTSIPALARFGGYLVMAYTGEHDSEIYVTRTPDGTNWAPARKIGQQTSVPALAPHGDYLYMVYSGAKNKEIWSTRSRDGLHWTDMRQIGQQTSVPALARFGGYLVMAYTGEHDSEIYVTLTPDGTNWTPARKIGQQTSVPALAQFGEYLYMVYTDSKSSQLWVTRSANGLTWVDTQKIDNQGTSVPALASFGALLVAAYSGATDSQLWETYLDRAHAGP
jgi:hypothetical protein